MGSFPSLFFREIVRIGEKKQNRFDPEKGGIEEEERNQLGPWRIIRTRFENIDTGVRYKYKSAPLSLFLIVLGSK